MLFWVDEEHNQLWRFPTAEETKRNEQLKKFMDKEFITLDTVSLLTEAYKKVDMSGSGAQFVLNVPNAQKHPKFNSEVDEKYIHRGMLYDKKAHPDGAPNLTRCVLSVPIANTAGQTICVIQLRNKLTDKAVQTEFNKSGIFRTDDATFLQHFALQASSVFEHALAEEEGRDAVANLEQSEYCARSLMHISLTLAKGDVKLDDLFPLVVSESVKLINCDRATLFLVHEPPGSDRMLWSKIATGCPPIMVPLKETSIAGATVCNSVVTNIADAYRDIRFDPQVRRMPTAHGAPLTTHRFLCACSGTARAATARAPSSAYPSSTSNAAASASAACSSSTRRTDTTGWARYSSTSAMSSWRPTSRRSSPSRSNVRSRSRRHAVA